MKVNMMLTNTELKLVEGVWILRYAAKPQLLKWSVKAVVNKRKRCCIMHVEHQTFLPLMQRPLSQSVCGQESACIPVYLQEIQIPVNIIPVRTELRNRHKVRLQSGTHRSRKYQQCNPRCIIILLFYYFLTLLRKPLILFNA